MKKTSILILVSLIIFCNACNNKSVGFFTVNCEVKNMPNQQVYLEEIFMSEKTPVVLDTAEVKDGKFILSANATEEGLYRIRFQKNLNIYLIANDQPEIKLVADANNEQLAIAEVQSPANKKLQSFIGAIVEKSNRIEISNDNLEKAQIENGDSLILSEKENNARLKNEFQNYLVEFIEKCDDPVVTMFAIGYTQNIEVSKMKPIVNNLSKRFPTHNGIKSFIALYNAFWDKKTTQPTNHKPGVGDEAPDFKMMDENGVPFSLKELRGKYVLVDFWASWCGPCRGENPNVVVAYNKFKNKNFTVLGVSLDEKREAWVNAIKEDNLTWKHVSDLKGWESEIVPLYGFDGIPYNVLIDPNGKIIATELREEALLETLENTFSNK